MHPFSVEQALPKLDVNPRCAVRRSFRTSIYLGHDAAPFCGRDGHLSIVDIDVLERYFEALICCWVRLSVCH